MHPSLLSACFRVFGRLLSVSSASARFDESEGCVIDTGHIPLRALLTFTRTGKFDAPTDDCQRGDCSWSVGAGGEILIEWGEVLVSISDPPTFCIGASAQTGFSSVRTQAGKHSVRLSSDRQSIVGFRIKDREKCAATFERPLPTCHSPAQARAHTHSTHASTHTHSALVPHRHARTQTPPRTLECVRTTHTTNRLRTRHSCRAPPDPRFFVSP